MTPFIDLRLWAWSSVIQTTTHCERYCWHTIQPPEQMIQLPGKRGPATRSWAADPATCADPAPPDATRLSCRPTSAVPVDPANRRSTTRRCTTRRSSASGHAKCPSRYVPSPTPRRFSASGHAKCPSNYVPHLSLRRHESHHLPVLSPHHCHSLLHHSPLQCQSACHVSQPLAVPGAATPCRARARRAPTAARMRREAIP